MALQEIFAQTINSITSAKLPGAVPIDRPRSANQLSQFRHITICPSRDAEEVPTYITNDFVVFSTNPNYLDVKGSGDPGVGVLGLVISKAQGSFQVKVLNEKWRKFEMNETKTQTIYAIKVNNLITSMREFTALCKCRDYPLLPLLLSGNHSPWSLELDTLGVHYVQWLKSHFNQSQQEAIIAAATSSGFTLIKGTFCFTRASQDAY